MVKVNLTGVAVGFEPVPDGEYKGKFTAFKADKTKAGDPMYRFEFTVDEPEEYAGRKLFVNQTIIPTGEKANLHYLKQNLVRMGSDPDDLEDTLDLDEILKELRGNEVVLKVGHREYEGKTYNDVDLKDLDSWS